MRPGAGDRVAWAAAVLVAAQLLLAVGVARDKPGTVVDDPYYGEVLFHFYQRDDFTALTHLLAARQVGRLDQHKAEAELLLGGLYLSYGQHREAGRIFEFLLDSEPSASVRDRAWFYLGKVRFQRGLFADALLALEQVGDELPEGLAAEYYLLRAQSHMGLEQYAQAAAVLHEREGSEDWLAYGRYNLGVALVRMGDQAAGAKMLNELGLLSSKEPELVNLRDKANLALGYTYLQSDQAAAAREVLRRVRLNGPFSSKALLGVGWADALQENYRDALLPWLELRYRDLLDGAVQESLLAIPYAYGKLAAHGSAADHYINAVAAFDGEMAGIDRAIQRANSGQLVPRLLFDDDPEIGHWYWQLGEIKDNSDGRYLYHLVANHDFQEGLRNYRDLVALQGYLQQWSAKLVAYQDMVDTRQQAYDQRLPIIDARLSELSLPSIRARRDEAAARLARARQARDVAELATADERYHWDSLMALEANPALNLPAAEDARQRQRILKGVLLWNFDREFNYRVWQQTRKLVELDALLAQAEAGVDENAKARRGIPEELRLYRGRIAALAPRIDEMQLKLAAALGGQERRLQALAVRELEAQKERLATYRVQARFALATIYDRANAAAAGTELKP